MSMLSSMRDDLKDRAHELRMFADGLSAPYVVPSTKETMALSMNTAASRMEDAADMLWRLRELLICERKLNVEKGVENIELRELICVLIHCMSEVDNCDTCPINGNPHDVSIEWSACDTLREMLEENGFEV